jgi:sirohydrochlorin ferrochelatase
MLMLAVQTGVVIFAHGSSVASANEAVQAVANQAAAAGDLGPFEVAFLEAQPSLAAAVGRLADTGVQRILVVPYFLTLGLHLQRDLPALAAELRRRHPETEIRITPPLDGHPALSRILADRAMEAISSWK